MTERITAPLSDLAIYDRVTQGYTLSNGYAIPTRIVGLRRKYEDWIHEAKSVRVNSNWVDHSSLWNKNGKPAMYITQPYDNLHGDISQGQKDNLAAYCKKYGLAFRISAKDSWWNPGKTVAVIITKAA